MLVLNLSGAIPKEVIGLSSLSIFLVMSNNSFPFEVAKLINIVELDLSDNKLSGEIPGSLSRCLSLEHLNLGGNFLQGTIPESQKTLRGLEETCICLYSQVDKKSSRKFLAPNVVIPVTTGVNLGLLLCYLAACVVIRKSTKKSLAAFSTEDWQRGISYTELAKSTNGFSAENLIGSGSFGSVCKRILGGDGAVVSVKVLNLEKQGASKSFMDECNALKNIRHHIMDMLMKSDNDIQVPEKARVVTNGFGSTGDATDIFNKLCKEIMVGEYFCDTCSKATEYSKRFWLKNMAHICSTCSSATAPFSFASTRYPSLHASSKPFKDFQKNQGLESAIASGSTSGNETDRIALLDFKNHITQVPFQIMSSWNDSLHFCHRIGVKCNPTNGRVTILNLESQNLFGSIPPSVGNLTFLTGINLKHNNFQGEIPQEIGRLIRLQHLNLSYNSFSGKIPSNISQCRELTIFHVIKNRLVGQIPEQLGSLSKLVFLAVDANNLSGIIPASIGNLSSLYLLSLMQNSLQGTRPEQSGLLSGLGCFQVSQNGISGTVPLLIYNISSLYFFNVVQNNFQGKLPPDVGHTLPNLNELF
ncbi:hypothetical protein RHMOL_Rhmol05G0295400 [Rhododendron molle]|uniref:Uncharacterized protein n=1 Tax=Rhododendron molle TaxID=49168 RepID=A0ACC0NVD8_RHOML|nr:hypothetical protein RHMOL_Rhmol05G0295400 [Rhododendron molle]